MARPRVPPPLPTILAISVLTVAAAAVGQWDWAVPERVLSGWQVSAVPHSLTAMLVLTSLTCLLAGAGTTLHDGRLRLRDPAFVGWLVVVLHWAFTFVPALLAGLAAHARPPATALASALGTGVVTVPLLALGFSLFASREPFATGLAGSLWTTVVLGLLPLALAALVARNLASRKNLTA